MISAEPDDGRPPHSGLLAAQPLHHLGKRLAVGRRSARIGHQVQEGADIHPGRLRLALGHARSPPRPAGITSILSEISTAPRARVRARIELCGAWFSSPPFIRHGNSALNPNCLHSQDQTRPYAAASESSSYTIPSPRRQIMGIPPRQVALTRASLSKLLDPGRVFYRPHHRQRGLPPADLAKIQVLIQGARGGAGEIGEPSGPDQGARSGRQGEEEEGRDERWPTRGGATTRPLRGGRGFANRVPVSIVWEITLACDLACQHCGSRAGRRRRGRAEHGGVPRPRRPDRRAGHARRRPDRRRGLSAQGLARDRRRGPRRRHGMRPSERRPQPHRRARSAKAAAAGLQGVGISIDGLARGPRRGARRAGLVRARRSPRCATSARHGMVATVNTQINARSMPQLRELMDIDHRRRRDQLAARHHRRDGQCRRPARAAAPALADARADAAARRAVAGGARARPVPPAGQQHRLFRPLRIALIRNVHRRRDPLARLQRRRHHVRDRGGRHDQVLPGPAAAPMPAATSATRACARSGRRAEPLAFTRRRTVDDLWGFCRTCYYAETCMAGCTWTAHALFGRPGNNPMCHYRALEMDKAGLRERLVKVKDAGGRRSTMASSRSSSSRSRRRRGAATGSSSMAEQGRIAVPLRLCRGCRQFVRIDGRADCVSTIAAWISTRRRPTHEANVIEMHRAADALQGGAGGKSLGRGPTLFGLSLWKARSFSWTPIPKSRPSLWRRRRRRRRSAPINVHSTPGGSASPHLERHGGGGGADLLEGELRRLAVPPMAVGHGITGGEAGLVAGAEQVGGIAGPIPVSSSRRPSACISAHS